MQNSFTSHQISSDTTTNNIRVQAFPEYIPEQSNPELNRYSFGYKIVITNNGDEKVKLLSRYWIIINSEGDQQIAEGPGVVGYTPELMPGESFEYSSHCPLNTNWGTMEGYYTMLKENGETFEAKIERFYLISDEVLT
jgi:ApaG protein